ncbi:hypothetical protein Palpr_0418 [Paludibacter propionicigenes WB4]|uniref:Uncharacterized protein n=1 Tax=Paludibacter propionicigenes (strain DSM 17365 / JCM 13257 / WB4) TaxID=694427 RepID=E4T1I4_PALPW|nr:hypothetical protein Palpr_0418 [Paludibacter propionicigenes WB4]
MLYSHFKCVEVQIVYNVIETLSFYAYCDLELYTIVI